MLASFLAQKSKCVINVISHLVRNYGEPFGGLATDSLLIVFEPLFNVYEVSVEGTLVGGVDHPNDEDELDQTVEVAGYYVEMDVGESVFNLVKCRVYYPKREPLNQLVVKLFRFHHFIASPDGIA